MSAALGDLKAEIARGADPREWVQAHPWLTLASAAVAGFTAAAAAIPSKEQQALRRLEAIQRALHASHPQPAKDGNGNGAGDHASGHGIGAVLIREAIGIVKPIALSILTARLTPREPAPPVDDPSGSAPSEQGS